MFRDGTISFSVALDSGSDISAIPPQAVPNNAIPTRINPYTVTTAGGPAHITHHVILQVTSQIGGDPLPVRFFIMDNLNFPILGYLDMERLGFSILYPSVSSFLGFDQVLLPRIDPQGEDDIPIPHDSQQVLVEALKSCLEEHEAVKRLNLPCQHQLANYIVRLKEDTTFDQIQPVEYPYPAHHKALITEAIEKEIELGWLTPVTRTHPLQSPARFVVSFNIPEKPRVCVNAIALNSCMEDVYSHIPRIDATLRSISVTPHTIFSKIDISKAYYACPWDPSQHGLLYIDHKGIRYGYTRCPFGLKDLPNHFCRLMQSMMGGIPGVILYFDDILVFSNDINSHISTIQEVINRCSRWHLPVNAEKCRFGYSSISYLGLRLSRDGLSPSSLRVRGIKEMTFAPTRKGLLSFMGLVNYCRQFILGISELMEPLEEIKKIMGPKALKIPASLHPKFHNALDAIIEALSNSIILALPPTDPKFVVHTDASDIAVAGVLGFIDNGVTRVCATFSSKLKGYEANWSVPRKELYAVVRACKTWEHELLGREFLIRTDHHALIYQLSDLRTLPRVLTVWANFLSCFNYQISHVPGTENVFADLLSRAPYLINKVKFHKDSTTSILDGSHSEKDPPPTETPAQQPQVSVTAISEAVPDTHSPSRFVVDDDMHIVDEVITFALEEGVSDAEELLDKDQLFYDPANLLDNHHGLPVHNLLHTPLDAFIDQSTARNMFYHSNNPWVETPPVSGTHNHQVLSVSASHCNKFRGDVLITAELTSVMRSVEDRVREHNAHLPLLLHSLDTPSVCTILMADHPDANPNEQGSTTSLDTTSARSVLSSSDPSDSRKNPVSYPPEYDSLSKRLHIIKYFHDFAHESTTRLIDRLRDNGHDWVGLQREVKRVVASCVVCVVNNYGKSMFATAQSVKAAYPFDVVQVDTAYLGEPSNHNGVRYTHLMVYIDVFTGFIILEPLRSTAMKEASNVIRRIFGRFGPPRRIITDGGPEYSSIHKAIDEMTTQWGCSAERVTTAPHTPRATGKAERAIQDVKRLIYKFCSTISSSGNYKQHWAKGVRQRGVRAEY